MAARMNRFTDLVYDFPVSREGYAIAFLEACIGDKEKSRCAVLLWRAGKASIGVPDYIAVGPALTSASGEYRHRFVSGDTFIEAYERRLDFFSPLERAVLNQLTGGYLTTDVDVYPKPLDDSVTAWVRDSRIDVKVLAVALALDVRGDAPDTPPNTSPSYRALLESLVEAEGVHVDVQDEQDLLIFLLGGVVDGGEIDSVVDCGVKLLPVSVRGALKFNDFMCPAWREELFTRVAGDLVLNLCAPSLPFYNQASFVEEAGAGAFESPAVARRFRQAAAAERAAAGLREARRAASGAAGTAPEALAELEAIAASGVDFARQRLLLSPIVLALFVEHTGFCLSGVDPRRHREELQCLSTLPGASARLLFDFAFGLHCLHSIAGVAHAGVKSDKLTVAIHGVPSVELQTPPNASVCAAYVAGPRGEADTFVFPAGVLVGCVAGFSAAVAGEAFRPHLLATGAPPHAAEEFLEGQRARGARALAQALADAGLPPLEGGAPPPRRKAFAALCAADFAALGRAFAGFAGAHLAGDGATAGAALGRRLEAAGRRALEAAREALKGPEEGGAAPPLPGLGLLAEVFAAWRFPALPPRRPGEAPRALVAAYNWNNGAGGLRFSSRDYALFPPWSRLDEIERHLGDARMSAVFLRDPAEFLASLRPAGRAAAVVALARAREAALDRGDAAAPDAAAAPGAV